MTEQAHTSPSGESTEDKRVSDVSHSVLPHCKKVPAYNDYKPSTRVKQAAFNSSANIFNPPVTGRDCVHNTALAGKQIMGFFPAQSTAKIDPGLPDARMECTSLNHFLCCHNLVVSEEEASG